MSGKKREAAKVVLIDTQYVQTDTMSFKSVVQKLTGKDCSVAWIKESNSSSADAKRRGVLVEVDKLQDDAVKANDNHGSSVSMLSKCLSFEDLDRLILEVPSQEELQWLWTEYNFHFE